MFYLLLLLLVDGDLFPIDSLILVQKQLNNKRKEETQSKPIELERCPLSFVFVLLGDDVS